MKIPLLVLASLTCAAATAQTYPSRPIRYIVPQAPGGSSDTLARLITQRVAESLGLKTEIAKWSKVIKAAGIKGGES